MSMTITQQQQQQPQNDASFDITRLTEVRAKMMMMSIGQQQQEQQEQEDCAMPHCAQHLSVPSIITTSPLTSTKTLSTTQEAAAVEFALSSFFKRGDYELYKAKQQGRRRVVAEELDDESCDSSCASSSSSSSSQQTPTPRMVVPPSSSQVRQQQAIVDVYRQQIRKQEIEMDALYAKLTKAQRQVGDLKHSRGVLIEELCAMMITKSKHAADYDDDYSSSYMPTTTILKFAMLFGLFVHFMGGASHCLAIAVFGWWLAESFA